MSVAGVPTTARVAAGSRVAGWTMTRTMGFLALGAVLLPLMGRTFAQLAGVHPRIISYAFIGTAVGLAFMLRNSAARAPRLLVGVGITLVVLLASVLWSFDWADRAFLVVEIPTVAQYPAYKLTRIALLAVPLTVMGLMLGRFAVDEDFEGGMRVAGLLVGGIGLLQFARHYGDLSGSLTGTGLGDDVRFSTISLSLVFLHVQIIAQTWAQKRPTTSRMLTLALVSVGCLYCYYVLSQRTPLILNAVFLALLLYRVAPGRVTGMILVGFGLYLAYASVLSLLYGGGSLSEGLRGLETQHSRYGSFFGTEDRSTLIRIEMVSFCLRHGFDALFGHGLGRFPAYFLGHLYPHNVLAEAFFEQGIVGLVTVGILCLVTGWVVLSLFLSGKSDFFLLGLLVVFANVMKAGNLSTMGSWCVWLCLAVGVLAKRRPVAAPARRRPPPRRRGFQS